MIFLRILLLFILIGSGILFLVRKLSFSQFLAPLVTITGITTILYVFALFNFLKPGLIITVIVLLGMGILSFLNWPSKIQQENKKISPPLVAWGLIFFFIAVYTAGTLFYQWDEFSYWGVIYKYLMSTNHLPDLTSNLTVSNYPPFTALFQYFVGTIVKNSESSAYFAHILLAFSSILAILPNKKWHEWKKYTILLSLCILSVFPFDLRFQSLYVDLTLGVLFAAGLASAAINENFSLERVTTIALASTALILTKPLGIVFAMVCIGVLYFDFLFKKFQIVSTKSFFTLLLKPLLKPQIIFVIGVTLLAFSSWNIQIKEINDTKVNLSFNSIPIPSGDIYPGDTSYYLTKLSDEETQINRDVQLLQKPFEIDISVVNVLRIFTVNAPYRTKLIIENFIQSFSIHEFMTLKFTSFTSLLFILLITLLIKVTNSQKEQSENSFLRNNVILLFGFITYAFALLFAYIYYFTPSAGIQVPDLWRYLSSYLFGWWLLVICCLYQQQSIEIPTINVKASDFVSISLIFMFLLIIPFSAYFHSPRSTDAQRFEVNRIVKAINNKVTKEDKIYDIWQVDDSFGLNHYIIGYYLSPIGTNNYGWQISPKDKNAEENQGKYGLVPDISPDDWLKLLHDQHFTYVLVSTSDKYFWANYDSLFNTYLDKNVPQLFLVTSTGLENIPIQVKN